MVEQRTVNPHVEGSIPSLRANLGIAQPGSARALGAWGREFDSLCRDQCLTQW